jgi:hypothetical protein
VHQVRSFLGLAG